MMTKEESTELLQLLADIMSEKQICDMDWKEKEVVRILQNKGYISIEACGTIKGIK